MNNDVISQISRGLMVLVGIGIGRYRGQSKTKFVSESNCVGSDDTTYDVDLLSNKMSVYVRRYALVHEALD